MKILRFVTGFSIVPALFVIIIGCNRSLLVAECALGVVLLIVAILLGYLFMVAGEE